MPYTTFGDFDYDPTAVFRKRRSSFDPADPFADDDDDLPAVGALEPPRPSPPPGAKPTVQPGSGTPPDSTVRKPEGYAATIPASQRSGYATPVSLPPTKSAMEQLRDTLGSPPERAKPGRLQGVLATGVAALGGFYGHRIPTEQTQRAVQSILYPGYERRLEDWNRQVTALGGAAEIEARQAQEKRLEAQHQAAMKTSEARLASEQARLKRLNMPPVPKAATTYEGYLVGKLQGGTPEEQKAAEEKLDKLRGKDSPEKNLIVREFQDEPTGNVTLRFYDPVTGEMKREEKLPGVARRRPPSPLTGSTLDYREKLGQARDLAGQAQRLYPNDRAKAREWLAQQAGSDDELLQMALEKIGTAPASKDDKLGRAKKILGIEPAPATGGGNPYRR